MGLNHACCQKLKHGALGLLVLGVACKAPGHKLNVVPTATEQRMEVAGTPVTLRPITAALVKAQPALAPSSDLSDLLVSSPRTYRVGPQDALLVTVWDHPELTLPLGQFRTDAAAGSVVDDQGGLFYPYVGRIEVGGLTVPEIRARLTKALDKVLKDPQVDVKVIAYRSQKVYVGGEVKQAGAFPITEVAPTLTELATQFGGFLPTSDQSQVVLTRGGRSYRLNFLELMAKGRPMAQILLQDGDALHVPSREESPVYLMGEVRNPRSVPMFHGRLTLAQAISEAGGINQTSADARCIYVLRGNGQGIEAFHLDGQNPAAMVLADRFVLQPRDMVYVDPGTLVRWNRVLSLLVPTLSALTSTTSDIKFLAK